MDIPVSQRGVVVVISLASAGKRQLRWLYRGLEQIAKRKSEALLGPAYGSVRVLTRSPDPDQLVAAVQTMGSRVDVVDVVLVVHGEPERVIFGPGVETSASLLGQRLNNGTARGRIRLVYSTACFGQSHAQAFVTAGARAAIGAVGQNTNGVTEFEALLRRWVGGESAESAMTRADQKWSRVGWDLLARTFGGFRRVDSEKRLVGNGAVTIDVR